jgi:hypothetical protein
MSQEGLHCYRDDSCSGKITFGLRLRARCGSTLYHIRGIDPVKLRDHFSWLPGARP